MKRIICAVLISVFCMLAFAGCKESAWSVSFASSDYKAVLTLSADDAKVLEDWLLSDGWVDDVTNCATDVSLKTADGKSISYHSECGTINYLSQGRSKTLSESEKESFNALLSKYGSLGRTD